MGLGRLFKACLLSNCCQHEAKQLQTSSCYDTASILGTASARRCPHPEAEEPIASAEDIAGDTSSPHGPTNDLTSATVGLAPTHSDCVCRLPYPRTPPSLPTPISSPQSAAQPSSYPISVAASIRGSPSSTSAASIQTASVTAQLGPTQSDRDDSAAVMCSISIPSLTFNLQRLGGEMPSATRVTSSSMPVSVWEDSDAGGPGAAPLAALPTQSEMAPRDECVVLLLHDTRLAQEPCSLSAAQSHQQHLEAHQRRQWPLQQTAPGPLGRNVATAPIIGVSAAAAAFEAHSSLPLDSQRQQPPPRRPPLYPLQLQRHEAGRSVLMHMWKRPPVVSSHTTRLISGLPDLPPAMNAAAAAAPNLHSAPLTALTAPAILWPHYGWTSCGGSSVSAALAAASSSLQVSFSGTDRSPCRPSPSAASSPAVLSQPYTLAPSAPTTAATTSCSPLPAGAAGGVAGMIRPCRLSELGGQLSGLRWLASGSSGCVYTGSWQGSPVAVKVVLSSTPDQLRESTREALLSRVVSHPAICQCYTVCSQFLLPEHLQLPTTCTAASGRSATLSVTSISTPCNANTAPAQSVSSSLSIHLNACGVAGSPTCCGGRGGGGDGAVVGTPVGCGRSIRPGGLASPRLGRGVEEEGEGASCSQSLSMVEVVEAAGGCDEGVEMPSSMSSPGQGCPYRRRRLPPGRREPQRAAVPVQNSRTLAAPSAERRKPAAAAAALCGSPAAGATLSINPLAGMPCPVAPGDVLMHVNEMGPPTAASSPCSAAAAREARWPGTVGSEMYTTLSLSELLRTYMPADDDGVGSGAAAGSLPAVLMSMGAAPGRCCTVVVMEWCKHGTLLQAIRSQPFNPERSADNAAGLLALLRTALEVAQGMAYLHSLDIIHGDLKPSNVLLQSHATQVPRTQGAGVWATDIRGYVAKVADFGMAVPACSNSLGTAVSGSSPSPPAADSGNGGTGHGGGSCGAGAGAGASECNWGALAYLAPEVPESGPSKKSDVYSYGCVLYHMCTGKQPFRGIRQGRLLMGLATRSLTLQWPDNVYRVLRRLGQACCATDPRERPSFDKLVTALQKTIAYVASTPAPGGSGASLAGSRKALSGARSGSSESRRRLGSVCGGEEDEVATAAAAWRLALAGCGQLEGLELFAPLPAACGVARSGAGRGADESREDGRR